MDDWEIDDETMAKCLDDFEAQRNDDNEKQPVNNDVEYVPETQFDPIPDTEQSVTSSLNARLRAIVANQRPGKEICVDGNIIGPLHPIGPTLSPGAYPVCHCGDECVVVVAKTEKNAGRRFFGCSSYEEQLYNSNEGGYCNYMQWIDPPMCARGLQYALEMQAEVKRLNKLVEELNRMGCVRKYP